MEHDQVAHVQPARHAHRERARRVIIWGFIIAAIYAPAAVALAIILTGSLN